MFDFFLSSLHNLSAERLKILSEDFITGAKSGQWLLRHDISLWGQQQRHCADSPSRILVVRFFSIPERAVAVTESSVSTPLALQKALWEHQRRSFSNSTCCHLMEVGVRLTEITLDTHLLCHQSLKSHMILNYCLIFECTDYYLT